MQRTLIKISIVLFLSCLNNCYGNSKDYCLGYAQALADEIIPEEKFIIMLDGRYLNIIIKGKALGLNTEQTLLARLMQTKLFDKVKLSYQDKIPSSSPHNVTMKTISHHPLYELLPAGTIYDSPIADPKWPKFSAGYQRHFKNNFSKNIFHLSFGENLPLLRYRHDDFACEFGIQAGVFGIMDISSNPTRLINTDYFVGIGMSFIYAKHWQNLLQISHLSSHLGDELLINNPALAKKRINLSYETLKWLTAYKFNNFRPYVALAYMVHRDPSYIKPFSFDLGCDYLSENKFLFETTRYVFGVHGYFAQKNNYSPTVNVRTGLQLENPVWHGRSLQFLIEYANGNSRHGQFYWKKEQYIGILVSLST